MLWTFIRWTLAFLLVYGYAIFLGFWLNRTPTGWVTQNVKLGSVYLVGSEESPLGLQATDLEWIDKNNTLQRAIGVVVGNVFIVDSCDVIDVPPELRAPTTSTTLFGAVTTTSPSTATTTAPPAEGAEPPAPTTTVKPVPGQTKVVEPAKVCSESIPIRYDPSAPAATVQVVGAKDIEVGAPALVFLILVGTLGFFAFFISLAKSGFPPNEHKGSVAVGVVLLLFGVAFLAAGPALVEEEPVLAMSMVLPALYCFFHGSTRIRQKLRKRDPEAALPEGSVGFGQPDPAMAAAGPAPWTPEQPTWQPPPAPGPPGQAGPPPPWPGAASPSAPEPGPPTPWANPAPQPPFSPDDRPDPGAGATTSF